MRAKLMNVDSPTEISEIILAAYYAKNMGLPINKLICASNENKVLYDFILRQGAMTETATLY